MRTLPGNALQDTLWGSNVSQKEEAARKHFGIPPRKAIHLILDTTLFGSCKVGFALCDDGIWFKDERGEKGNLSWKELKRLSIAFDDGVLLVGSNRFLSNDGAHLAKLFKKLV